MAPPENPPEDALVLAPSLGRRFSGINATMEALLPAQRRRIAIACCGTYLSDKLPRTTLSRWLRSPQRRRWRIWHARRNNDMLVGLLLRYVLRQKLILLWTSAAQRHHTWLTRFCYHRMDAVIATTEKAASYLRRPAEVIHHGVDTTLYRPPQNRAAVRAELGLPDRPTLGVFGRIRPQKGTGDLVDALLEVLPDHPEWQVLFVGAATGGHLSYQAELEAKLKAGGLSDRVTFTGYLQDFAQLPQWYQACDVVGCVSRTEGFGVTCLEGMASGSPVLATEAGAWPDIITEGANGWLAKAGDPRDLARAVRLVFETPVDELHRRGEAARATVTRRFTIEHEALRVSGVYEQLFRTFGQESAAPPRRNAA